MPLQVDKSAYNFRKYCGSDRLASYWRQLDEVINCQLSNVLEIGVGDQTIKNYLTTDTEMQYQSADIAADLASINQSKSS